MGFATAASDQFPQVFHDLAAAPPSAGAALGGLQTYLQAITQAVGAHFHVLPALIWLAPPLLAMNWPGVIAALLSHSAEIFPGVDLSTLQGAVEATPAPALALTTSPV